MGGRGRERERAMPAARQRAISSSEQLALSARIGVRLHSPEAMSLRMLMVASSPSITLGGGIEWAEEREEQHQRNAGMGF